VAASFPAGSPSASVVRKSRMVPEKTGQVSEGCITLLTDYGVGNEFVGSLHAVIARIAPSARVIDLDHTVPAQNVRVGALRLERLISYAPEGAHVGVVDPGVGGARRPIAVEVGAHVLIGPDNGLLVWAAHRLQLEVRAFVLDREEFWLPNRGKTFDGRDIFAPCAAHLLLGHPPSEMGSPLPPSELVALPRPTVEAPSETDRIVEVIDIDRFGNVVLGVTAQDIAALDLSIGQGVEIVGGETKVIASSIASTFGDVDDQAPLVYLDSGGWLSFALNGGDAATTWNISLGERLTIRRRALQVRRAQPN
jgi:S-adenosyl-L-methionine hydrolase (adenosine-forming)